MDRLPIPMANRPPSLFRAGIYLLVPVLLTLMLPVILLLVMALYLLALFQGARALVMVIVGKKEEPESEMHKPHFLDMGAAAKAWPDESLPPPKG